MNNLLNNVEIVAVEPAAVAGTSELTSDVIDLAGWTGVTFIAYLGDVTAASVVGLVADDSDSDAGGWDDLESPLSYTAAASDADNKLLVLDINRPNRRYVRARLTRITQNAVVNGIIAIKYGPRSVPVTQGSTVLASATVPNADRA